MTLGQIKLEAAKLAARDRLALAKWLAVQEDVQGAERDELIHELQIGIEEAERGELIDIGEAFANLRAGLRANP